MNRIHRALKVGIVVLCLLAGLGCGGGGAAAAGAGPQGTPLDPAPYVLLEPGTLPIVLSAPHGGTLAPPGVPERTQGTTVLDTRTLELAQAIQARLQALAGGKAHLVAARVSRKFVDFNRAAEAAYETPAMAPVYEAYQRGMAQAMAAVRSHPRALLVDLHGQSADVSVVYRGTRDGRTADLPALLASGAFLERLAQAVALVPPGTSGMEHPDFNGGYLVATYGRLSPVGADAVQLEFGYGFRTDGAAVADTAERVARALVGHLGQ